MDYEKKYKEALELARVAAFNGHQSLMEGIFPELAESKDERIRKSIAALIEQSSDRLDSKNQEQMIAWVEKQGEQKSAEWSSEDESNLNCCLAYIKDEYLRRWLKDAIHVRYDKSEWSEKDEQILNDCLLVVNQTNIFKDEYQKEVKDWLKSLKSRVKCADVSQQPDKIISEEVKHVNAMDILLSDIDVDAMVEKYKSKFFMPPLGDLSHYDFYIATMCSVYRQGILDTLYQLKTK